MPTAHGAEPYLNCRLGADLGLGAASVTLWGPMLLMGVEAVVAGLVVSWVWGVNLGTSIGLGATAWPQGRQFLGEGFVLVPPCLDPL